jgi:hypothetical protein
MACSHLGISSLHIIVKVLKKPHIEKTSRTAKEKQNIAFEWTQITHKPKTPEDSKIKTFLGKGKLEEFVLSQTTLWGAFVLRGKNSDVKLNFQKTMKGIEGSKYLN